MSKKATVKITSDTKEAQTGIQKVTSELNKFAKQVKGSDVVKFGIAFGAATKAVNIATAAIKKTVEVVHDLEDAYRTQIKAEKQLEVAAQNNPYLDHNSVRQLEDYASHLQSVSTVGDESLIPMMAQLASAGRTQTEIQEIMSAALDVSASGMMSLDEAVKALNKTYSGTAGQLGNQITAIKSLTAEQLKNGEAIKIIAEQFKGMAEQTTAATGSAEQLKNAAGDLKEEFGAVFEEASVPMRKFFTEAFSNLSSYLSELRKTREDAEAVLAALERAKKGVASLEDFEIIESGAEQLINKNLDKIDELQAKYDKLSERKQKGSAGQKLKEEMDELEKLNDGYIQIIELANVEIDKKQLEKFNTLVKEAEEVETVAAKQSILTQAQAYEKKLKNSQDYKRGIVAIQNEISSAELIAEEKAAIAAQEAYKQKIRIYKEEIAQREKLGETISEEAKITGEIEIRQKGLFELVEKYNALDWDTADIQEYADEIKKLYDLIKQNGDTKKTVDKDSEEKLKNLKMEAESLISQANSFIGTKDSLLSTQIKDEISALEEYMQTLDATGEAYSALSEKKNELATLQTEVQKKELEEQAQNAKDKVAEITESITTYVDKFAEITKGITNLVRQSNEQETEEAMTELSEQYTDGEISYEEYCEKKKEINKKAAQEEYKLKMWEWGASMLQATANTALGVAKALAEGGPYVGPILAALIGASGAIQIATIIANKPKPPSFATGGIVPGTSYSGDKVQANVNSGEMILNAQQQANLWKMANNASGGGAVVNMPVTIENRNGSNVHSSLDKNGMRIIIDDMVNASMQEGRYQKSMQISQSKEKGVTVL